MKSFFGVCGPCCDDADDSAEHVGELVKEDPFNGVANNTSRSIEEEKEKQDRQPQFVNFGTVSFESEQIASRASQHSMLEGGPRRRKSHFQLEKSKSKTLSFSVETQHEFIVELHNATLIDRSSVLGHAKEPYAILYADGVEIERTTPLAPEGTVRSLGSMSQGLSNLVKKIKRSHAEDNAGSTWDVEHSFECGDIPDEISIAIWSKCQRQKDIFCGSVTVPCAEDMGAFEEKEFILTKDDHQTGVVTLSLKAREKGEDLKAQSSAAKRATIMTRKSTIGGEFDMLVASFDPERMDLMGTAVSFKATNLQKDASDEEVATKSKSDDKTAPASAGAHALDGSWKCIDTHGLDDFLRATGVGMFQRKLANAAAWPSWDFNVQQSKVLFINHSAIGDLREEIPLGAEYEWVDGHHNHYTCTSVWTASPEGGSLVIERKGGVGNYKEERTVTGDKLVFILTHSTGVTWGRTFERKR